MFRRLSNNKRPYDMIKVYCPRCIPFCTKKGPVMTHSSFIKAVAAALLFTMTAGFSVTAAAVPSFTTGKALHRGDCIGITGTATAAEDIDIPALKQRLGEEGFSVKVMPTVTKRYGYFSGTDAERAGDLNELFADDSVTAILCFDGGYGSARILDKLDYDMIRTHAKPFIGFSDTTALHIALEVKSSHFTDPWPIRFQASTKTITHGILSKKP